MRYLCPPVCRFAERALWRGQSGGEAAGWLDEPESLRSLALIALREAPGARAFGLLVIGSPDAQRFGRDMQVDFLMRMGQLASAALVRLRTPA